MDQEQRDTGGNPSLLDRTIRFCLENKLVMVLMVLLSVG